MEGLEEADDPRDVRAGHGRTRVRVEGNTAGVERYTSKSRLQRIRSDHTHSRCSDIRLQPMHKQMTTYEYVFGAKELFVQLWDCNKLANLDDLLVYIVGPLR